MSDSEAVDPLDANQLRQFVNELEDKLLSTVSVSSISFCAIILAAAALIELGEPSIPEGAYWNVLRFLAKVTSVIFEAIGTSIIVYFLIDRRIDKIRLTFLKQERLIRITSVLSAVMEKSLDQDSVSAWTYYIREQVFGVTATSITFRLTKQGEKIEAVFETNTKLKLLQAFSGYRPALATEEWRYEGIEVKLNDVPQDPHLIDDGPFKKKYLLVGKAADKAEIALRAKNFDCARMFSDNHVFSDGARNLVVEVRVDKRLMKEPNRNPIQLYLPPSDEREEWREYDSNGESLYTDVNYRVFQCQTRRTLIPYQGFSYTIALE